MTTRRPTPAIESHTEPGAKPRRRGRRPSRRTLLITGSVLIALVATPVIVNEITPRPYVSVFRALIGQVDSAVQLGPYEDDVASVTVSDLIDVPVDGAPDAGITFYTDGNSIDAPKPVILLVHGGGWVVGSASQIGEYAKLLASQGFVVANLTYSLAPEQTHPTQLQQSAAALDYLHEHAAERGGNGSQLFVAGNSAGAQLAGQLAAVVTNSDLARTTGVQPATTRDDLKGVILYSGPYDFDTVEQTGFPGFRAYAWSYTGKKDWQEYDRLDELSVTRGASENFPPTYMTAGDADPLEPQTYELDAVLRARGVDVTSRYWTGSGLNLPHDYIYDLRTDAARTAFTDTVDFVMRHVD
jgi:acetyl esterase